MPIVNTPESPQSPPQVDPSLLPPCLCHVYTGGVLRPHLYSHPSVWRCGRIKVIPARCVGRGIWDNKCKPPYFIIGAYFFPLEKNLKNKNVHKTEVRSDILQYIRCLTLVIVYLNFQTPNLSGFPIEFPDHWQH